MRRESKVPPRKGKAWQKQLRHRHVPPTVAGRDTLMCIKRPWSRSCSQNKSVLSANINSLVFFNTWYAPNIDKFKSDAYIHECACTHSHTHAHLPSTAEENH